MRVVIHRKTEKQCTVHPLPKEKPLQATDLDPKACLAHNSAQYYAYRYHVSTCFSIENDCSTIIKPSLRNVPL